MAVFMKKVNIATLELGDFEKIKNEFTFESRGNGTSVSALNTVSMGNYNEAESEFLVVKEGERFIYFVSIGDQSILIESDAKVPSNNLPSFFKEAFLSKSLEDAEAVHVLGRINIKDKYPVKTGFLQIVAIEAKDPYGQVCLYPMDSTNNIYSLYRGDGFKATKQQEQDMKNLKITTLTKQQYLDLLISMDSYEKKTLNKNISFDEPSF